MTARLRWPAGFDTLLEEFHEGLRTQPVPRHGSRVQKGATTALVGLTLPSGATATASVTNDAVEAPGLADVQAATATFKAYAVMVAVKA